MKRKAKKAEEEMESEGRKKLRHGEEEVEEEKVKRPPKVFVEKVNGGWDGRCEAGREAETGRGGGPSEEDY